MLSGARVVIAGPGLERDPAALTALIDTHHVTVAHFVPSMLEMFLEVDGVSRCHSLRLLLSGGELLTVSLSRRVVERLGVRLDNLYGPTEVTVTSSSHMVDAAVDTVSVPIGTPVWNTGVLVLDSRLRPVPVGVAGELYLWGTQLARGYSARPDLTADRFVANPYSGPGERMYRTGDLVRWTRTGELDYIGRADFQVKLRGMRIELGDIETALRACPGVNAAVATVHHSTGTGDRLVGYVTLAHGQTLTQETLRTAVAAALPDYMVPAQIVVLDALPLTGSGKVDRRALPVPVFESAVAYRAPRTDTEQIIAGIFADVLGTDRVGVDDDFFAAGGNSLTATRIVSGVNKALGTSIGLRDFFATTTTRLLAACVELATAAPLPPLVRTASAGSVPLSHAQTRIWFLNRLEPESPAYNMPVAIRLTGALDTAALQSALVDVIERHESLRSIFPDNGDGPRQIVLGTASAVVDLDCTPIDAGDAALRASDLTSAGFDLRRETPLRAGLYRVEPEVHVLVIVIHHVCIDELSLPPLTRDLLRAYEWRSVGEAPPWPPLDVQYSDFARWQREVLGNVHDPASRISKQLDHWRQVFPDVPNTLEIPGSSSRPIVRSTVAARVSADLEAQHVSALRTIAAGSQATLFMALHAALAALLARLCDSTDVVIGTPMSGRHDPALDDLVGMFVNTAALRTRVDRSDHFEDLLRRCQQVDLDAIDNGGVPFEQVVEAVQPVRSASISPLFQITLALQEQVPPAPELLGLHIDFDLELPVHAVFDLEFTASERADGGLDIHLIYAVDLIPAHVAEVTLQRYLDVLRQVAGHQNVALNRLELLPDFTSNLSESDEPNVAAPAKLLWHLLDDAANAHSQLPAIHAAGEVTTYGQLRMHSDRLAAYFAFRGVKPGTTVAVILARSADLQVAVWAILKCGAAYLPIDPSAPHRRIEYILNDAGAQFAVGPPSLRTALSAQPIWLDFVREGPKEADPEVNQKFPCIPLNAPAYVIYTSGTSGSPKGVVIPHAAAVAFADALALRVHLDTGSKVLNAASPMFDASILEMLLAIVSHGSLVVAPHDVIGGRELAKFITDGQVDCAFLTPSVLQTLDSADVSLRTLLVGGEPCPRSLVEHWAGRVEMYNAYGPTEFTVAGAISERLQRKDVTPRSNVTVGRAVAGAAALVLDSSLRPTLSGALGELYLAGDQLGMGYMGRPALTAERFVAHSDGVAGARMYRTGDLARRSADGRIEIVGRSDAQVKIRGLRIELGEVESVLSSHLDVVSSAVRVHGEGARRTLVAYVVWRGDGGVDITEIQRWCAEGLPDYMVPRRIVEVASIPVTVSGKTDWDALPSPELGLRTHRPPESPVELLVADAFARVLGTSTMGLDDHFFDLGGDSLSATRVVAMLGNQLGIDLPVRTLFRAPTVSAYAVAVTAVEATGTATGTGTGGCAPVDRDRYSEFGAPLSSTQQRMWFLNRLNGSAAAYNIPLALRFPDGIDADALRLAICDVIDRHQTLRTVYPLLGDQPRQVVLEPPASDSIDLIAVSEDEIDSLLAEFASGGFDLTSDRPLRARLLRPPNGDLVAVVVIHHIAVDGSSMAVLARDVGTAYAARREGKTPAWSPLAVNYADYVRRQREFLGDERMVNSKWATQRAFWELTLAGVPEAHNLPADRPRPPRQSFHGQTLAFTISGERERGLRELARRQGATMFMALHAVLAVVLARCSGDDDIVVGTAVAGRTSPELESMVGMFVNTLALRTRVGDEDTFAAVLDRVADVDLAALDNADIPFDAVVHAVNPARSMSASPIFQTMLVFQNYTAPSLQLDVGAVRELDVATATTRFDLEWTVVERETGNGTGMECSLDYATDLYDEPTVASFVDRFLAVMDAAVADPATAVADLNLGETARPAHFGGDGPDDAIGQDDTDTLVAMFDRQSAATPLARAITAAGVTINYADFAVRVRRLARSLIARGIGPDSVVGVAMPRSVDQVVAVHAIISAGAAYTPLDTGQPIARLRTIAAVVQPVCLLVESNDFDLAGLGIPLVIAQPDGGPADGGLPISDTERTSPLTPNHPAYVILTSGSTGVPKGVVVTHRAIASQLRWCQDIYGLNENDAVLYKTPLGFDISVWEIFWTLHRGARLVVSGPDDHRDPTALARLIADERVTTVHFVPSMLSAYLEARPDGLTGTVERVFVAGERLPRALATRLVASTNALCHNWYGPAEAAVVTAGPVVDDGRDVPIGSPVHSVEVMLLDRRLRPVPPNVVGELYIAGAQLARGYASDPVRTAERFVANPSGRKGERIYRTGDLGRADMHGVLHYIGRADDQVKMHGVRVELGEVESALLACAGVRQAAVKAFRAEASTTLVAFVAADVDQSDLKRELRLRLPANMVPSRIVVLEGLPATASGKIDRSALTAPDPVVSVGRRPDTPAEQIIDEIVTDVIGSGTLGADESFFDVGMSSLAAIRVVSRINDALGCELTLRDVFEADTVALLARQVEYVEGIAANVLVQRPPRQSVSITPAQHRMWSANDGAATADWNLSEAWRLTGPIDFDALTSAFLELLQSHSVLRTCYPSVDGSAVQHVLPIGDVAPLLRQDVDENDLADAVGGFLRIPFDLRREAPVRAAIFVDGDDRAVLAVSFSHVAVDDRAMSLLARDLVAAFERHRAGINTPPWRNRLEFADFAYRNACDRGSLDEPTSRLSNDLAYWCTTFAEGIPKLDVLGRYTALRNRSSRAHVVPFSLDAALHSRLAVLAANQKSTLFAVMQAAFAVMIAGLSGARDVLAGTAIAGRDRPETFDMIGNFAIDVPLRIEVNPNASFRELVRAVQVSALKAFEHSDVSEQEIRDVLDERAGLQVDGPLFQFMLVVLERAAHEVDHPIAFGDIRTEVFPVDNVVSKHDLEFSVAAMKDVDGVPCGVEGLFVCPADVFTAEEASRLARTFVDILTAAADRPDKPLSHAAHSALLPWAGDVPRGVADAD
ncbi:amino acid adenylation domain-containing protein [Gordonia sp. NPDC058843]|uniref:amino acid adenylation domain-containing protein n=1 Tax=Gordonia sp. NPDC058843 TaxID=3346648 RepID=UPI00368D242E